MGMAISLLQLATVAGHRIHQFIHWWVCTCSPACKRGTEQDLHHLCRHRAKGGHGQSPQLPAIVGVHRCSNLFPQCVSMVPHPEQLHTKARHQDSTCCVKTIMVNNLVTSIQAAAYATLGAQLDGYTKPTLDASSNFDCMTAVVGSPQVLMFGCV